MKKTTAWEIIGMLSYFCCSFTIAALIEWPISLFPIGWLMIGLISLRQFIKAKEKERKPKKKKK